MLEAQASALSFLVTVYIGSPAAAPPPPSLSLFYKDGSCSFSPLFFISPLSVILEMMSMPPVSFHLHVTLISHLFLRFSVYGVGIGGTLVRQHASPPCWRCFQKPGPRPMCSAPPSQDRQFLAGALCIFSPCCLERCFYFINLMHW